MKRIYFFATPRDIGPVLDRFESNAPLKFVELGTFAKPNRPIHLASSQIPEPGISTHETGSASKSYMVSLRDAQNHMRPFSLTNGQKRWSLDNSDNEDTVQITLAGLWTTGTLLPGNMSTLHQTPVAQQLMKWFRSALKQERYTKICDWWLGEEALDMLKSGKRLTITAEQSPPQYNLTIPPD